MMAEMFIRIEISIFESPEAWVTPRFMDMRSIFCCVFGVALQHHWGSVYCPQSKLGCMSVPHACIHQHAFN